VHFSICDFITDIAQNAIEADSRFTKVEVIQNEESLIVRIADTGKGMTEQQLEKAKDPFITDGNKHPGRKVGLGIPFLVQALAQTEGDFDIRSEPGEGTTVSCRFNLLHLDTPPLGSLTETFRQILTFPGDYEMTITRGLGDESYTIVRSELVEALGDLSSAGSLNLLKTYLESQEESLHTD